MAFFRPSWASLAHSHTPSRPRVQRAQELAPERLGLCLVDIQADHLAAASLVHAVGDDQALLAHPATLADALDFRIEPQVGVAGSFVGALAEGGDLIVRLRTRRLTWSLPIAAMPSRSTLRVLTPWT